jgi:hypothetical protein
LRALRFAQDKLREAISQHADNLRDCSVANASRNDGTSITEPSAA